MTEQEIIDAICKADGLSGMTVNDIDLYQELFCPFSLLY
jgi:hypothetical protein